MKTMRAQGVLIVILASLALTACAHVGPTTVSADRLDYSSAIGE